MLKKSLSERIKINLITGFFASYILPMTDSLRWTRIKKSDYEGSAIFAIWHGHQFVNLSVPKKERIKHKLLISPSNDGDSIANVSKMLGFGLIRGSVKRRGAEAAREIISALENGANISYTIDGPKGPIYKVKPGIIRLAQMAKAPIIPLQASTSHKATFSSWDKYEVPGLFSKSVVIYGEPIFIPQEITDEELKTYQELIEQKLHELKEETAQILFNRGEAPCPCEAPLPESSSVL